MDQYSPKVMQLFRHPKNIGVIKNANGIGLVGNIVCGDQMKVYIKVSKNKSGSEIIKDVKVQTFGCIAAIATSSAATQMVRGKTIEEALHLTREQVRDEVGGLPPIKFHCSVLAVDGIKEAIYDYLKKSGKPVPAELQKEHERISTVTEEVEHRTGQHIH